MTEPQTHFNWDNVKTEGAYVKFETPGQSVAGVISDIGLKAFPSGDIAPELTLVLDDGTEQVLTAGQADLKRKLKDANVQPGEHVEITYVANRQAGQFSAKVFTVVKDTVPF